MASVLELATKLAQKYHAGQVLKQKKGHKNLDYFLYHLLEVKNILSSIGVPESTQTIGILHDILEDTKMTYETLVSKVGKDIADKVALLSEDKSLPKIERTKKYLGQIIKDKETISVSLADQVNNSSNLLKFPPTIIIADPDFISRQIKKYNLTLNRLKKIRLDKKQLLLYNMLKSNVKQLEKEHTKVS